MDTRDLMRLARRAKLIARSPFGEFRAEGLPAVLVAAAGLVLALGATSALRAGAARAIEAARRDTAELGAADPEIPPQRGWWRLGA